LVLAVSEKLAAFYLEEMPVNPAHCQVFMPSEIPLACPFYDNRFNLIAEIIPEASTP
jgi:hypothetical protein